MGLARPPAPPPPRAPGAEAGKRFRRFGRPQAIVVRLDRFLFFIRLMKSRTLAQSLIEQGHVRLDGKRVSKTSEEVAIGSVIAIPLRGEVRILRVLALPTRRGPAGEARTCYEELGESGSSANVSQESAAD